MTTLTEPVKTTKAMTYLRMNSAPREWLNLPDGVPYGMVVCGLIDHTMRGLKPASVTKKVTRL